MKIGDRVMTCEGFHGTIICKTFNISENKGEYLVEWDTYRKVSTGVKITGGTYFESELRPIDSSPTKPIETDWRIDYANRKE
jgi:hypothetical protein